MALASSPTALIDIAGQATTVYLTPTKLGRPRNRFVAVEVFVRDGERQANEWFGSATREKVAAKARGGPWHILDTAEYDWTF